MQVIAEANDGKTALNLARKHRTNLVLLALPLPDSNVFECLARMKNALPKVPVVLFSSIDEPTYLARAFALGAAGYLLKSAKRNEIVNTIRTAAVGKSVWSHDQLRRITGGLAKPRKGSTGEMPLTKRESEVLKQIALGLTNQEIAQSLGISYETVKEHVQHILRKLDMSDRTQAAVWAVRKELV